MYGIASHITHYCLSSSWTSWLSCTVPRVEGNSWENEPISEGLKRRKNETRTDVNAENEVLRSGMTRHVPHIIKKLYIPFLTCERKKREKRNSWRSPKTYHLLRFLALMRIEFIEFQPCFRSRTLKILLQPFGPAKAVDLERMAEAKVGFRNACGRIRCLFLSQVCTTCFPSLRAGN